MGIGTLPTALTRPCTHHEATGIAALYTRSKSIQVVLMLKGDPFHGLIIQGVLQGTGGLQDKPLVITLDPLFTFP
jgi:hypothetical protein